jgi:hypothetical protein
MEEGGTLQPISHLAPAVHSITCLFHQSQAGGGSGFIIRIISAAPAADAATAAAAAAAAEAPARVMIASLVVHLLPDSLLDLLDSVQHQCSSGKGFGRILARRRDVRQGGFERSKLLEEQHSWKDLLLSGQSCQGDASSGQSFAQCQDLHPPHPQSFL